MGRDGKMTKIDLWQTADKMLVAEVDIAHDARAVSVSGDGKYVIGGGYRPPHFVIADALALEPLNVVVVREPGKTYTVGFAIHDDYTAARFHHVSLAYHLGFDDPAADINVTGRQKIEPWRARQGYQLCAPTSEYDPCAASHALPLLPCWRLPQGRPSPRLRPAPKRSPRSVRNPRPALSRGSAPLLTSAGDRGDDEQSYFLSADRDRATGQHPALDRH